jgi:hypothetical protein
MAALRSVGPWAVLAFCVVNWCWTLGAGGCWWLRVGLVSYHRPGVVSAHTTKGLYSEDGRLVFANCGTFAIHTGMRPPPPAYTQPVQIRARGFHAGLEALTGSAAGLFLREWEREAWHHSWGVSALGFVAVWQPDDGRRAFLQRGFAVPWWFLGAVFSITPARQCFRLWLRNRGHRRRAAGLCADCGYDLRASKDRCPECGAAPTTDELLVPKDRAGLVSTPDVVSPVRP